MQYVVVGLHPCGRNKSNIYESCRNRLDIFELPAIRKLRGNRHWCMKIIIEAKIQCQHIEKNNLSKHIICSTYFRLRSFSQQDSQGKFDLYLLLAILPFPFPSLNHPTASYLYPLSLDIAPGTYAVSSTSEDIVPGELFAHDYLERLGKVRVVVAFPHHVYQYSHK